MVGLPTGGLLGVLRSGGLHLILHPCIDVTEYLSSNTRSPLRKAPRYHRVDHRTRDLTLEHIELKLARLAIFMTYIFTKFRRRSHQKIRFQMIVYCK